MKNEIKVLQTYQRPLQVITAVTVLFFLMAAVMSGFPHISGPGQALHLAALFGAAYGLTLGILLRIRPETKGSEFVYVSVFLAFTLLARVIMLEYDSADYNTFLSVWVDVFRQDGFRALRENVGNYNLLYQYALLLISKSSLYDLYLIKLFSILFDYALALAMLRAVPIFCEDRDGLPVFLIVCILPTTLINGAFWGQCDSVYAFFVILFLCDLETGHPWRSASFLALAFAFKLQTIFVFPVVLLGLIHGKFKPRHALAFFGMYLFTMLPSMAAGRSFTDALSVYASQSMGQNFDRLTYNAPNLYFFFPLLEFAGTQEYTWMRFIKGLDGFTTNAFLSEDLLPLLQNATLYACILLVLLAVIYWLAHYREVTPEMTLLFALFFAIFLPFVMPKMHERYFYLADMLSILYAVKYRNRVFVPVMVVGASFMSYMVFLTRQRPVDERVLSLLMFASLIVVSRDLLQEMRKVRKASKGGDQAC